jgi:hypothetical protein
MPSKKKTTEDTAPVEEVTVDRNQVNMAEAEQALDAALAGYNAALIIQNVDAMREAEAAIEKAEQDYAEAAECAAFALCKAEEHPMLKAAEIHSFRVLKHKAVREDSVLTGYEKTDREKPIDLEKLAKKCGLPTLWVHLVENLNQILTLRVAKDLGATAADLKAISKSYFMTRATGEMEAGATPTSNTQLVKLLQTICDKILGENVVRVNNHDIAYIEAAHTKKGRAKIGINTAQHNFMRRLILDVLHRCVTGAVYEVEYKKNKA